MGNTPDTHTRITVRPRLTAPVNHIRWNASFFAFSYIDAPSVCPMRMPTAEPRATNTTFSRLHRALEMFSPATISSSQLIPISFIYLITKTNRQSDRDEELAERLLTKKGWLPSCIK